MERTKILIVGIGGVGGFFGGLLAKRYENDPQVEVYFLSRGSNLAAIQKEGLKVIAPHTAFRAKPKLATDNVTDIGVVDYVVLCTKTYDLEETLEQVRPCIAHETVVLPLLNGVGHGEFIRQKLPKTMVWDGCVYIIARLNAPGEVENKGNIQKLFFGLDGTNNDKLTQFEGICQEADIEVTLSAEISKIIWEKFIFISSMATATSFYDRSMGQVLEENRDEVKALVEEVSALARHKNIAIREDITVATLTRMASLPYEATSSMHSDIQNKKPKFEFEALTAYIVNEGQKQEVPTPVYQTMYKELKKLWESRSM